ncbi:cytochrome-c peroxidase [Novosphingobium resinovorum]|uniref:cytochrome-c peroxidase n=1 Tax=Novosphingobium resinovorum TaxID=158500 RepID=UPI002ED3F31D|nr:cytochrome c peroxidase [Novosphingobium resinovorum]
MPASTIRRAVLAASTGVLLVALRATGAPAPPDAALRALYAGPPQSWPRPWLEPGARFTEFAPVPETPEASPADAARIALGQRLFEEPRLSGSGQIACASCHNAEMGFTDGLRTSFGHDRQRGRRNAPALFAARWTHALFWDGREASLEGQVLGPLSDPLEMAGDRARVERWINRQPGYRQAFAGLIGSRRIRLADIAAMIAAYERSLAPPRNRWDRVFAQGPGVLSDQELRGLHLFRTKAGCANCHSGALLTDDRFHNLGLGFYGTARQDLGRWLVTGRAQDVGAFRTPTLRGLIHTRPYMHNGFFPFLEPVVMFYAGGGGPNPERQAAGEAAPPPQADPLLKPRDLTREDREALVAFLRVL